MMIVGGFNVMPAQIEDVLRSHPAVHDAVVVQFRTTVSETCPSPASCGQARRSTTTRSPAHCRVLIEALKVPGGGSCSTRSP